MTAPTRQGIESICRLLDGMTQNDALFAYDQSAAKLAAAELRRLHSQPGGALAQDGGEELPPDLAAEMQSAMRSYHAELMVMARVVMKKRGQTPIPPPAAPAQPEATATEQAGGDATVAAGRPEPIGYCESPRHDEGRIGWGDNMGGYEE